MKTAERLSPGQQRWSIAAEPLQRAASLVDVTPRLAERRRRSASDRILVGAWNAFVIGTRPMAKRVLGRQAEFNAQLVTLLEWLGGSDATPSPTEAADLIRSLASLQDPGRGGAGTRLEALVEGALKAQAAWNRAAVDLVRELCGSEPDLGNVRRLVDRLRVCADPLDPAVVTAAPLRYASRFWRLVFRRLHHFNTAVTEALGALAQVADSSLVGYRGFTIPEKLILMTGDEIQNFDVIARLHLQAYAECCPIQPSHSILEVGCGIGRDAMHLVEVLRGDGCYRGVDITPQSIDWCSSNITAPEELTKMLSEARLRLVEPLRLGSWSGRQAPGYQFQDICLLAKA